MLSAAAVAVFSGALIHACDRCLQVAHTITERNVLGQIDHPFIVGLNFAFQVGAGSAARCTVCEFTVCVVAWALLAVQGQIVLRAGLLRGRRAVFSFGQGRSVCRGSCTVLRGAGTAMKHATARVDNSR